VDRGCRVVSATDPPAVNLSFLDRSRYFSIQVSPQLSSRGWVYPVPDPLLLRKSDSSGNRTRYLWICSQKLWPLDHRGGPELLTVSWNLPETKANKEYYLMRCDRYGRSLTLLRRNILPPSSGSAYYPSKQPATSKKHAEICFNLITWRHIPELALLPWEYADLMRLTWSPVFWIFHSIHLGKQNNWISRKKVENYIVAYRPVAR
jgi:hypothetical protein